MSVNIAAACKKLDYRGAKREVLLELADHANDDGVCWPSRSRIMYNTGLSESAVKRQMKELREAKVIEIVAHHEGGRGKVPIYKLHPEKGPQKIPFDVWCEDNGKGSTDGPKSLKGSTDAPERGHDVTPEPSGEPSIDEESTSYPPLRLSSQVKECVEILMSCNLFEDETATIRNVRRAINDHPEVDAPAVCRDIDTWIEDNEPPRHPFALLIKFFKNQSEGGHRPRLRAVQGGKGGPPADPLVAENAERWAW